MKSSWSYFFSKTCTQPSLAHSPYVPNLQMKIILYYDIVRIPSICIRAIKSRDYQSTFLSQDFNIKELGSFICCVSNIKSNFMNDNWVTEINFWKIPRMVIDARCPSIWITYNEDITLWRMDYESIRKVSLSVSHWIGWESKNFVEKDLVKFLVIPCQKNIASCVENSISKNENFLLLRFKNVHIDS